MAYQTGTATDYQDMLSQLIAFLTTNATLVGLNQQWTLLADASPGDVGIAGLGTNDLRNREVYLQGPGLAGEDEIFCNIRTYSQVAADYFNWQFVTAAAYTSANSFLTQALSSPPQHVYLWNQTIKYWIYASGRVFVVGFKVNNVYMHMTMGLALPLGLPAQYGYPAICGGMGSTVDLRYSEQDVYNRAYWDGSNGYYSNSLYIQWLDGTWKSCGNWQQEASRGVWSDNGFIWPTYSTRRAANVKQGIDGTQPTYDFLVMLPIPRQSIALVLEGLQWTPGFGIASEATFTDGVSGKSYVALPNAYRSSTRDYMALLCE